MARTVSSPAGSVVAITGGARGIGRASAAALVAEGARVAIGDIDRELAGRVALEIGAGTIAVPLDVTSRESFQAFLDEAERRLGPLDALVNCAGIMPLGPFVGEPDAVTRRALDANLHGVLLGSKLALARFLPRGGGRLVNLAGAAGRVGFAGAATYAATQHAVVGLSKALRSELRGSGVEVHLIMPVLVETEMTSGLRRLPAGRTVAPEEVAAAVVEALTLGTPEVYVPRSTARILGLGALLPPPVRSRLVQLLRADRILATPDPVARAAYEARIAPLGLRDPAATVASAAESVASAVAAHDRDG